MRDAFQAFSDKVAAGVGSPYAFLGALALVLLWAISGPLLHFSEVWQLTINTGTTIVTFLTVFLIQATQNRDGRAIHLKLDEVLRAQAEARTELARAEEMPAQEIEAEIERIKEEGG